MCPSGGNSRKAMLIIKIMCTNHSLQFTQRDSDGRVPIEELSIWSNLSLALP